MSEPLTVVTGGAGFIGNAVAAKLHAEGARVLAIDDFSTGRETLVARTLPVVRCDLRDKSTLEEVLPARIDSVIHCAAQSSGEVSFDDPWDDMTRHIHATVNLLEASRARGVNHFVYTSSMAVYGDPRELPVRETDTLRPLSFYGAGKAAAENYVRLYCRDEMAYYILRPFSVYGPGQDIANLRQGMISIYLSQLLTTDRVVVKGSLDRFRDFVYIDDAVNAVTSVLGSSPCLGETFNLCSGTPTTVREVLAILLRHAGFDWDVVEQVSSTPGDQFGVYGDNSALKHLGHWSPVVTLQNGIGTMWDTYAQASETRSG
jgi:UDP-glucose 4-epimerase